MSTTGIQDHADAIARQDLIEIDALLTALRDAWDRGDAAAYADLFTQEASYVIYVGAVSLGRAAIRRDHEPVLGKWQKGSRMRMRVLDVQRVTADVVSVITEGGVGTGAKVPLDKVQTYTLVRTPQGWRCAAFQNTKKNRLFLWVNARATR